MSANNRERDMTDNKSSENRRKLLKTIAAGSGAVIAGKNLPENWARPVVDSVLLPAHAITSGGPYAGAGVTTVPALESDTLFSKAADTLVPQAQAIIIIPYVCVEPNAAMDKATVKLYDDFPTNLFTFTDVPVGGQSNAFSVTFPCDTADAGDLLENLGLIKDAHAGVPNVTCFLDSVSGVGAGRLVYDGGRTIDFSVGPGACEPNLICL
jgi:hypothetical protein